MLAQQQQRSGNNTNSVRFQNIQVYDRLNVPPNNPDDTTIWDNNSNIAKFYLIGLGGRGQLALQTFHLWDQVVVPRCVSVIGRRDWTPNGPINGTETIKPIRNNITTQVLPREKLVSILYQYIQMNYKNQITLNYNTEVQPIDFHYYRNNSDSSSSISNIDSNDDELQEKALIRVAKCTTTTNPESSTVVDDEDMVCDTNVQYISAPLLIAADGTVRTIANTISSLDHEKIHQVSRYNIVKRFILKHKAMYVKRYIDDNQRVYKTIPLKLPKDWRYDLNYSARTKRLNLEALPANQNGDYCGVLLLKHDDPMATSNCNPNELRQLFDETMPLFSQLISNETIQQIDEKAISLLPNFRYVGPRLHEGNCTLLLGDCAHTVKPYFGLGANSALEDVKILNEYLNKYDTIGQAIQEYSKHRTIESKTLVRISRNLDRPGLYGIITFIIPIILDAIFHKIAPKIFMPNTITMLQRESYTFQQLARRKRFDRLLQLCIIGTSLSSFTYIANTIVRILSKSLHMRPIHVWTTFICIAVALNRIQTLTKKTVKT